MNEKKIVNIVQKDPANPVAANVIADSIVEIAKAMKTLNDSRLKRRAIIILLHNSTGGIPRRDIESVLDSLAQLEKEWLK